MGSTTLISSSIKIGGESASFNVTYHSVLAVQKNLSNLKLNKAERQHVLKAIGSDQKRREAVEELLNLCGIFLGDRDDEWCERFEEVGTTSQLKAYRTLFFLPGPLEERAPRELSETFEDTHFYAGASLWLCLRLLGKSSKAAPIMKELGFSAYESYATFSEKRFNTIRRMCEIREERRSEEHGGFIPLDYFPPGMKPAGFWLMAEAALCRSRYQNGKTGKVTNSDKAYRAQAQKIKALSRVAGGESQTLQRTADFDETLDLLDCCIETDAARLASEDNLFEEQYWKDYKRSLKAWNSHRRNLKAIGLTKKKPGSKLGQKHQC